VQTTDISGELLSAPSNIPALLSLNNVSIKSLATSLPCITIALNFQTGAIIYSSGATSMVRIAIDNSILAQGPFGEFYDTSDNRQLNAHFAGNTAILHLAGSDRIIMNNTLVESLLLSLMLLLLLSLFSCIRRWDVWNSQSYQQTQQSGRPKLHIPAQLSQQSEPCLGRRCVLHCDEYAVELCCY
jgi:hypothetical protein